MKKHLQLLIQFFKERVFSRYTCTTPFDNIHLSGVVNVAVSPTELSLSPLWWARYDGMWFNTIEYYKTASDAKKDIPKKVKCFLERTGIRYNVMELIEDTNGNYKYAYSITPHCFRWYRQKRLREF